MIYSDYLISAEAASRVRHLRCQAERERLLHPSRPSAAPERARFRLLSKLARL